MEMASLRTRKKTQGRDTGVVGRGECREPVMRSVGGPGVSECWGGGGRRIPTRNSDLGEIHRP